MKYNVQYNIYIACDVHVSVVISYINEITIK